MRLHLKKNITIALALALSVTAIVGCGGAEGNDPGHAYMPDMYYSRAYEAYGYNNKPEDHDLKSRGAFFNGTPVKGTIARGDAFTFDIAPGDSGYLQARSYQAPAESKMMTAAQMKEGERLYLINCGICHGTNLDGNGPLFKGGEGPYPSAPRNLKDPYTKALSDGQLYHVITYGKGAMGSYASQLHPEQRWWVINYIKSKQGPADSTKAATPPAGAADSASLKSNSN
jgi:mono/diheme cytochrome c family protein